MSGRFLALLGAAACTGLFADDPGDRAKLAGAWEGDGVIWTLQQKGDSMRITQSHNDQQLSQIECTVGGQECAVKDAGHNAKIVMYFNGPKLVEMETRGSEVVKRRFTASGDALEIETIPIVPNGKPQVVKLKRK
ncbi:MAG: hypothetical protein LAO79_05710 [Acidobacteriia bacterium]|nr:hypothetical protein [Terriglobia bacterium]